MPFGEYFNEVNYAYILGEYFGRWQCCKALQPYFSLSGFTGKPLPPAHPKNPPVSSPMIRACK